DREGCQVGQHQGRSSRNPRRAASRVGEEPRCAARGDPSHEGQGLRDPLAVRELPLNRPPLRSAAGMLALIFLGSACGTAIHPSAPRPDAGAIATVEKPTPDASPFSLFHITPVLLIGDSIMVGARDIGGLQGLLEQGGWSPEIV